MKKILKYKLMLFFILNSYLYLVAIIFNETHCHQIWININVTYQDNDSTEEISLDNYKDQNKTTRYFGELFDKNEIHCSI